MPRSRGLTAVAAVSATFVVLTVGGCGSTAAGSGGQQPPVAGATGASPAQPPSDPTPASSASTAAASAASAAVFGANLCPLLPDATIDSTLGVHVTSHGWDGHVCSWLSKAPAGGATLGWISPGSPQLVGAATAGSVVPGLGVSNAGRVQTGLPAPLPPSQAFLIIDLGHGGMTVHVSGPAVTLAEAATLARDVLGG